MEKENIVLELENINRFFRGEELIDNPDTDNSTFLSEDQWTQYLKTYKNADQNDMAQLIGKLDQLDWREEDKLWWKVLLVSRCEGSEHHMREFVWTLEKFKHENRMIEELLIDVGRILINRESQSREKAYQSEMNRLQSMADIKEQKNNEARGNLQRYEQTGNR